MTPTGATPQPAARLDLAGRLRVALALVVVTGGLTAWLVAGAIGPAMFHRHMVQAGVSRPDSAAMHAEEAFRSAAATSLALAMTAAVAASLVVSVLLTRRISRSLSSLSGAASQVASGRFDSRVPSPGMGAEFDDLAASFNHMAAQLEASEALRHRLIADVAHELRTPVATLSAYLEALEDGVESLTPQTAAVLRSQAARLTRLADDLAAVTRAQSNDLVLEREQVTAHELVASAVLAVKDTFTAHRVTLASRLEDEVPPLFVDRNRMGQVLGNLLDNALRHTPPHGSVTVSAERVGADTVRLTVEDTGEGIAAEHLAHVFERFYRADTARDRQHGGSGIGLAIAQALVDAHQGTIEAHSAGPGHGSTFQILLPVAPARQ